MDQLMARGSDDLYGVYADTAASLSKGAGIEEVAKAGGVSVGLVRSYLREGRLTPNTEPCRGGFRYVFRPRDLQRLLEIASDNLSWLRQYRPGLFEYFQAKALEQGRRLPQSAGGR
jgi:hypothetical protein